MTKNNYKQYFEVNGYVIVDGLVSADQLEPLRKACDRVIAKARNNLWNKRRVVGIEFPPFGDKGDDFWGVEHLMHPDLQEPIFAQWYGNEKLLDVIKDLLNMKEDKFQLELFNLLINPVHSEFSLRWHRDDIRPDATDEQEGELLKIPPYGAQWNTALYPDDCLFVVPGSHNRIRTPEERRVQLEDSYTVNMPGAICVHVDVGQTLFYNSNILHRGVYRESVPRATLHACIGDASGGLTRARNILQHDLDWMREKRFKKSLPQKLHPYLENLIRLADDSKDKNLGYALS